MAPEVKNNLISIVAICKQMRIQSLYLFGSAVSSGNLAQNSDIDFLLRYKKIVKACYDYDLIDAPIIWKILENNINKLKSEAITLLEDE